MRLIDTHSHAQDPEFDEDRDSVIDGARDAGVETIVALGTDAQSSRSAVALAERRPEVYAACGAHPHDAQGAREGDLEELERLAGHPRVVMVGEIGLDFYRDLSPRDVERRVLRPQLDTAGPPGKPGGAPP